MILKKYIKLNNFGRNLVINKNKNGITNISKSLFNICNKCKNGN